MPYGESLNGIGQKKGFESYELLKVVITVAIGPSIG